MAIGDLFPNDGKLEAVVENLVGEPMILRLAGGELQSLDQFSIRGTGVQPAGAECTRARHGRRLDAAWRIGQRRQLSSRRMTFRLHFGLGSHKTLDEAEIRWPDGKKEKKLTGLAADRFFTSCAKDRELLYVSKAPERVPQSSLATVARQAVPERTTHVVRCKL